MRTVPGPSTADTDPLRSAAPGLAEPFGKGPEVASTARGIADCEQHSAKTSLEGPARTQMFPEDVGYQHWVIPKDATAPGTQD